MAIDLCSASDSSGLGMSPRISFSHDLRHSDVVPVEEYCHRSDGSLLDSSFDFDFGVSASFEQEPPFSADELFFDGKILPCEIREKIQIVLPSKQTRHAKLPPLPPLPLPLPLFPPPSPTDTTTTTTTTTTMLKTSTKTDDSKKESLKEIMAMSNESEDKASSKSFWRFKRSSSLNAGNGQRRSLICSLPLLSRSNSTGSSTNPKRQPLLKDTQKHSHKPPTPTPAKSSSFSSSSSQSQKPPLKKNSGSYGNGVRISPVLNIPPPYIAKGTASLFGLGSFFCGGKDKNKKK
ncbi:uncharacterized protein LOC122091097 [Macadamia integrifolia]|uniref:uncharacterized protein LOC122091097 n=1 Tax=Macadamia integrifolia TaxID=60698 RepID=UPI001C4E947A|nr:uncharacterized protein LOC122091097 [Macadamia integrifolia]